MFARVSTYRTGPETISDAPSEEIMKTVHEIPGSRGVYYLHGKGTGKTCPSHCGTPKNP